LRILKTISFQCFRICEKLLYVEYCVTALTVIIAAQPNRDVLRLVILYPANWSHVIFETSNMTCARAAGMVPRANINADPRPTMFFMTCS
jgi:hypothetical protein